MIGFGRDLVKSLLELALSERTKLILSQLSELEGYSKYACAKQLSRKLKIATSTIKFVLSKLENYGVFRYDDEIQFTPFGAFLLNCLEEVKNV